MNRMVLSFGLSAALLGAGLAACAGGSPDSLDGPSRDGDGVDAGPSAARTPAGSDTCAAGSSTAEKLADPSVLPACAPACAGARCVPGDKVPASAKMALATCSGGFCVPDAMIKSGGAKPPSCKSVNNADGVCLSVCVPQVAMYKDLLPGSTCAPDERCTPCVSPIDMKPTGACDIGASSGGTCSAKDGGAKPADGGSGSPAACPHVGPPVLDPKGLPACGPSGSGAHCLGKGLVPAALASQLATCATGLCVPDKLIASGGNFIPSTCASVNSAEGRCMNQILPALASQAGLPQSTCDANERCAPCFNPLDGKATGVCSISCDPGPTKPAVTLTDCCRENGPPEGKCAPSSSIPSALQNNLKVDTCAKGAELCVPTENLAPGFKPAACTATPLFGGTYSGVCLSNCLHFGFLESLGMDQGTCDNAHQCAPCVNPLSGQPTGAPGCPP